MTRFIREGLRRLVVEQGPATLVTLPAGVLLALVDEVDEHRRPAETNLT